MPDLLAGTTVLAQDFPATASNTQATDETGFTDTTYAAGAATCGVAFTAPTSGRVLILWHARFESNTADVRALVSVSVRTGSTVGSGTEVSAPADGDAIETSADATAGPRTRLGASSHRVVTGLTAGSAYNVRVEHKMSAAGNGDIFDRSVDVIPLS